MKNLYVLPGGGSPYNEKYVKVYDCIREGGKLYDTKVHVFDYLGCGHQPDYGIGLSLGKALNKLRHDLSSIEGKNTLFCRSFGCLLLLYIVEKEPSLLRGFNKIILWGVADDKVWVDFASLGVTEWNRIYIKKGVQLADDFFNDILAKTTEQKFSYLKPRNKRIVLSYGTEDIYSNENDNYYKKFKDSMDMEIVPITGAVHEITSENSSKQILEKYIKLIFKD